MNIIIECNWRDDWWEKYGPGERQSLFNRQDQYTYWKFGKNHADNLTKKQLRNWWLTKNRKAIKR